MTRSRRRGGSNNKSAHQGHIHQATRDQTTAHIYSSTKNQSRFPPQERHSHTEGERDPHTEGKSKQSKKECKQNPNRQTGQINNK